MISLSVSRRHCSIISFVTSLLRHSSTATNNPNSRRRLFAQPKFSIPIPHLPPSNSTRPPPPQDPHKNPNLTLPDLARISSLLSNPTLQPGPVLEEALSSAHINPSPNLLLEIFKRFDSSPKPLFTLYQWAEKQPDFQFSRPVFNAVINSLGKGRKFDSAWRLILDRINGDASERPDLDTFAIMIRRYARSGFCSEAIRTFKYASNLDFSHDLNSEKNLFEILLDSLCKEGHVRAASDYLDKHRAEDPSWSPHVRIYNILLNGWFRSRRLKHAEQLWEQMKKESVKPNVVSYGTVVEGLCRMRRPDRAIELLNEMRTEGVEPNAIVYNPIIDALAEDGKFTEALGMLERFSLLESGPTISTYNSLVKGFCKGKDLVGACKILNMMLGKKVLPTSTTYNYFFRYFSKLGKIEEGFNLYAKMIRCGYEPDRLTYNLIVKMLCEEGKLDLTMQIISEMRARGCDLDLSSSTMLIHLLCKMRQYDKAFNEFEDMIRRGIVPQYLTYQRLRDELDKLGMTEKAQKLYDLMASVPHSTKLPDTHKKLVFSSHARKNLIIQKAEAMSLILKTCKNVREVVKHGNPPDNAVINPQPLMEDTEKKGNLT